MPSLVLRGEELRCVEGGVSLDVLFDLAETDFANIISALAVMKRVVFGVVEPEDHPRLTAILATMKLGDFDELNQALGGVIAAESGRPTEPPLDSPSGVEPTGQPTKVVSLSRGTAAAAARSSKGGRSAVH